MGMITVIKNINVKNIGVDIIKNIRKNMRSAGEITSIAGDVWFFQGG